MLSTGLSTFQAEVWGFDKHTQPQPKKGVAYKKNCVIGCATFWYRIFLSLRKVLGLQALIISKIGRAFGFSLITNILKNEGHSFGQRSGLDILDDCFPTMLPYDALLFSYCLFIRNTTSSEIFGIWAKKQMICLRQNHISQCALRRLIFLLYPIPFTFKKDMSHIYDSIS